MHEEIFQWKESSIFHESGIFTNVIKDQLLEKIKMAVAFQKCIRGIIIIKKSDWLFRNNQSDTMLEGKWIFS